MPWPRADFVLYVLGAFVFAYGVSICVRARRARAWAARRSCPTCRRALDATGIDEACTHCGDRPPRGSVRHRPSRWVSVGGLTSLAGFVLFALGVAIVSRLDQLQYEFDSGSVDVAPDALLGPYVGAGMGISLFALFLGFKAHRGDRPRGRRRCPRCWYLVDEGVGRKCSECGHEAKRERDLFRPRRRWRLVMAALVLGMMGQVGWLEARVRQGGWLAAVPTEVLIVGMPWVPEWWLSGGHDNADEDWSLSGRMHQKGATWRWHEPWVRVRAEGWIASTRVPTEVSRRLGALGVGVEYPTAVSLLEPGPISAHLLEVGLIASESEDSMTARQLFVAAWCLSIREFEMVAEPLPEFEHQVDAHTGRLLAAYERDPSREAAFVLAMGGGRPEVVSLLVDHAEARRSDVVFSLANLAARHPHVQRQLAAILADLNNRTRVMITDVVCRIPQRQHEPELVEAVCSLARSENPDEAIEGVRAILAAIPGEADFATRRGLEIIESHPGRAFEVAGVLARSTRLLEFPEHLERLRRSSDRRVREAARHLIEREIARERLRGP